jgi:DNA helicase-2/ATP-dependent DNA helicase PcrA
MSQALKLEDAMTPEIVIQNSYVLELNPAQREAVVTTEGPVLILAGAGTGKTRALTTRLAYLIKEKNIYPNNVLAVTFTNKAAREMRERVEKLLNHSVEGMWLGTFHSLCVRILRRNAELINLHTDFTILDIDDQLRLIKQILKAEEIDEKKWPPRLLLSIISRWKDQALNPEKVTAEYVPYSREENPALKVYQIYQERLKILNAVDFGDLLLLCIELFISNPETLKHYQNLFKYIMVDEYQDTNVAQYIWLRLLAQGTMNICCVGDEDQSIYGWRGAEISNILKFEKDFPGAKIVRLEQNYRSTEHILGAASGLIAHNKVRLGKTLWTQEKGGIKVKVLGVWDGEDEARTVGEEIEALHRQGKKLSQIVVLVRAGFQTREFEERFLILGVPYRVIGGPRFYERQEIRDAIAYLRMAVQPSDGLALERIINTPRRRIGISTIQTLHYAARCSQISLYQAAWNLIQTDEIRGQAKSSLKALLESFERWRLQATKMTPSDFAQMILDESGYTAMWRQDKSIDAPGRLENLKELVNALKEYDTLQGFLEHVSLVAENNQNAEDEVVTVMSLHSAKGLEFDYVFLAGWEEELFPHPRALKDSGPEGLEEERRLAYVGITRARQQATILHASSRSIYGQRNTSLPSRFIDELPKHHIELDSKISSHNQSYTNFYSRPSSINYYAVREPSEDNISFTVGERVFHQKFGYGHVEEVEEDKLIVNFDFSGPKRVLSSFIRKG